MALLASAAPAQSLQAEASQATAPAVEVTVRSGRHPTFERFVFDWPEAVGFAVERSNGRTLVRFDRAAAFAPDASVTADRLQTAADGRTVVLTAPADATIRSFGLADHRVVVDFLAAEEDGDGLTAAGEAIEEPPLDGTLPPVPNGLEMLPADADPSTLVPLGALRGELYRRDLMIASLLERLEAVERGRSLGAGSTTGALSPTAADTRAGRAPGPVELDEPTESAIVGAGTEPAAGPLAGQAAGDAPGATPDDAARQARAEVERALERTLTRAGALLLRPGQIEVEPGVTYTRRTTSSPVFVANGDAGVIFVGEDQVERDEVRAALDVKAGLPFDSQVEVTLPYYYVDQSLKTMIGGAVGDVADGSGQAFGNPRLTLAKTLTRESGWWPDLVASAFWDTDFGKSRDNGIPLTGNFHEVGLRVSAVKRQDPLAFVGGLGVSRAFEKDGVEPGDTLTLSASAVLAASPATSLRFGFSQQFAAETKLDGDEIGGSDRTAGILTIGASAVLGQRALLDLSLDVGLSDDAPDYAVRFAVPLRFDLPIY